MATEDNLIYIRAAYATSIALQLLILFYIRTKILSKGDTTPISYKEPKKPFEETEPETIVTNVCDYDQNMVFAQLKQVGISVLVIAVVHIYFGYLPPLIMQAVLSFKNLLGVPLVKVHLLNQADVGELSRPWVAKSMFE